MKLLKKILCKLLVNKVFWITFIVITMIFWIIIYQSMIKDNNYNMGGTFVDKESTSIAEKGNNEAPNLNNRNEKEKYIENVTSENKTDSISSNMHSTNANSSSSSDIYSDLIPFDGATNNGSTSTSSKPSSSSSSSSNTGSNTKPSSDSTSSSSSNSGSGNSTTTTHTHKWVAVTETIEHEAEGHYEKTIIKEAWTETVKYTNISCNGCKNIYKSYAIWVVHSDEAMLNGNLSCGGYTTVTEKIYIEHDAEYQDVWVVDKEAWTETVTTGYSCSCGATK